MLQVTTSIASITFLELGDCLGWSYGRLRRMSRISGSSKLVCAKHADCDEASCELCLSHSAIVRCRMVVHCVQSAIERRARLGKNCSRAAPRRDGKWGQGAEDSRKRLCRETIRHKVEIPLCRVVKFISQRSLFGDDD